MDEKGMLKSLVCETAKLKPKVAECGEKTQKFADNAQGLKGNAKSAQNNKIQVNLSKILGVCLRGRPKRGQVQKIAQNIAKKLEISEMGETGKNMNGGSSDGLGRPRWGLARDLRTASAGLGGASVESLFPNFSLFLQISTDFFALCRILLQFT